MVSDYLESTTDGEIREYKCHTESLLLRLIHTGSREEACSLVWDLTHIPPRMETPWELSDELTEFNLPGSWKWPMFIYLQLMK